MIVDTQKIKTILTKHKTKIKLSLRFCAHCSLCAESCFLYNTRKKNPQYMPSHKIINSIGKLHKKKGNVDEKCLKEIKEIVWRKCVLCTRCYCPIGIDIPDMISIARSICRSQNIIPNFEEN